PLCALSAQHRHSTRRTPMAHTIQMLKTHPSPQSQPLEDYAASIHAIQDCAQTCISCADACMSEGDIQNLLRCIRLNLDCADICNATFSILSRPSMAAPEIWVSQLQTCALACRLCAEECRSEERRVGNEGRS